MAKFKVGDEVSFVGNEAHLKQYIGKRTLKVIEVIIFGPNKKPIYRCEEPRGMSCSYSENELELVEE